MTTREDRAIRPGAAVICLALALVVGFGACNRAPGSPRLSLQPVLPEGWYVAHPGPPVAYRKANENAGWLHVSVHPPAEYTSLAEALNSLMRSLGMETGELVKTVEDEAASGAMATSLFKSRSRGLLQFWLVDAGDAWIFASYTMGDLKSVRDELSDAQQIVKRLRIKQAK